MLIQKTSILKKQTNNWHRDIFDLSIKENLVHKFRGPICSMHLWETKSCILCLLHEIFNFEPSNTEAKLSFSAVASTEK